MKWLRILFRFYIDSSVHVALAICALFVLTLLSYQLPVGEWQLIFVFSASISAYNFAKFAEKVGFHIHDLSANLKAIQVFSLLNGFVLIYACFQMSFKFLSLAAFLAMISFLYSLPFLPIGFRLRELKSLKIFIIALVWTGTALWLPLVDHALVFSVDLILRSFSYFVFVLALILPFEIRDLKYDSPDLQTIPQRYGVEKTKLFGFALAILFVFFNGINASLSLTEKLIAGFIGLLVIFLLKFSGIRNADDYASFWVESVPILWLLIFLLF